MRMLLKYFTDFNETNLILYVDAMSLLIYFVMNLEVEIDGS